MPKNEFILAGKKFITSKKAALLFGYTQDYIGQLCRGEKIDARRIGRTWYVCEKSILEHKKLYNGGLAPKKEETVIPKEAKKVPVEFYKSDSGEHQVGLGETEIPKIGFGFATPKNFDEASRVASEFKYENEASPILPELLHSTLGPKKIISPFFQKSLGFVLALILVVGGYVYQEEIFTEAARGFRTAQNSVVATIHALKNLPRLNLAEYHKVQPPKLSWVDSKISAEQVAATFGSNGFVDGDKLAKAVSGATGIADFSYFENLIPVAEIYSGRYLAPEKLFALVEKVLPEKQLIALENVAQTTYEKLHPLFQKTGQFLASLFGQPTVINLAIDKSQQTTKISPPKADQPRAGNTTTITLSPRQVIQEITKNISYVGVSREEFEKRLADLAGNVFGQLATLSTASSNNTNYINNVYNTVAGTNNIDMLHHVAINDTSTFDNGTITNSPISGSTGSFTTLSGETLSVSGSSSLSTTTISKDLAVDTDTLFVDSTNNRVGIGTTSPTDTLSVNGPIFLTNVSPANTSNRLYANSNSLYWAGNLIGGATTGNWTTDGTNAWRATGNVGIGTSSPYAKLSVGGEIVGAYFTATTTATSIFSGAVQTGALSASSSLAVNNLATFYGGFVSNASSSIGSALTVQGGLSMAGAITSSSTATSTFNGSLLSKFGSFWNGLETSFITATSTTATSTFAGGFTAGNNAGLAVNMAALANSLYINPSGNVGIGTISPTTKLQVAGDISLYSDSATAKTIKLVVDSMTNSYDLKVVAGGPFGTSGTPGGDLYLDGGAKIGAGAFGRVLIATQNAGKVGIGETTPGSKLSVKGGMSVGDDVAYSQIAAPTDGMIIKGNVGIGTTSPYAKLSVEGSSALGNSALAGYFIATSTATSTFAGGVATAGLSSTNGLTISGGLILPASSVINSYLANSTIGLTSSGSVTVGTSPISLGGTSALNLNMANANTWTALQTFGNASTTQIGSTGSAYFATTNGNVGIGTTSPYAKLSVEGSSALGNSALAGYFTATSTTASTFPYASTTALTVSGALYIPGQCVTGDTKLRRRKKKKENKKGKGKGKDEDDEYIYDEVEIKDIKEGDEIQSLNEKTGKLIWSKVNKLMYMGSKPIFKLTTASGKKIRTTAKHPYFMRAGKSVIPKKKPKLGVFCDNSNMFYAQKSAGWKMDIKKLKDSFSGVFDLKFFNFYTGLPKEGDPALAGTLDYLKTFEKEVSLKTKLLKYIKTKKEFNGKLTEVVEKKGDMDVDITLDVTKTIDDLDVLLVVSGDSDLLPLKKYALDKGKKIAFAGFKNNTAWELTVSGKYLYFDNMKDSLVVGGQKITPEPEPGVALLALLYSKPPSLSSGGLWTKVKALRKGQEIAVLRGNRAVWDTIVSIQSMPTEDVYDIEIEGTHNFIGNDIVAHNTYLTGLGTHMLTATDGSGALVSTSTPQVAAINATSTTATSAFSGNLTVTGTTGLTGLLTAVNASTTQIGSTGSAYFATAGGNVGIGTTSPFTKLSVVGAGFFNEGVTASNLTATGTLTVTGLTTLVNASTTQLTVTGSTYLATTNGNVGIGTAGPIVKLDVFGQIRTYDTSQPRLYFEGAGDSWSIFTDTSSNFNIRNSTDSANRLVIDTSGNVGIGTTGPLYKLDVSGAARLSSYLDASYFVATTTTATSTFAGGLTVGTSQLVVQQSTGNVGIGTTNPTKLLEVVNQTGNGVAANSVIAVSSGAAYGSTANPKNLDYSFLGDTGKEIARMRSVDEMLNIDGGYLSFWTSTAANSPLERVRINRDGNVGIGTTGPLYKLDVSGAARLSSYLDASYFVATTTTATSTFAGGLTVGTSQLVVQQSTGNVGIGTTSPFTKLSVAGAGFFNEGVTASNLTATGTLTVTGLTTLVNASTTQLTVTGSTYLATTNGNVGIGTTSPLYKLAIEYTSDGNMFQLFDTDGNCLLNPESGAITTTCSSDARLKTDITNASPVLPYLLGLPIKDYKVIASGERRTGVVAQDLLAAGYADLVSMGTDGYYGVSEVGSWRVIKAIQELNLKIDSFASTTPEISSSFIDNVWNVILAKFADWGIAISQTFTRIANLVVGTVRVEDKLCVDEVCVSKDQLKALLVQVGGTTPSSSSSSPKSDLPGESDLLPPIITIQGNNPANIEVGATYADLGVIARDSRGNDLSVRFFVNGAQVSAISLDTSTSTSYTIDYSATDNDNLTATSTRVVNITASQASTASEASLASTTPEIIPEVPPEVPEASAANTAIEATSDVATTTSPIIE